MFIGGVRAMKKKTDWEVVVRCTKHTTYRFLWFKLVRKSELREHNTVSTNGQLLLDWDKQFRLLLILTKTQGIVSSRFVGHDPRDLLFRLTGNTLVVPIEHEQGNKLVRGRLVLRRVNAQKTGGELP